MARRLYLQPSRSRNLTEAVKTEIQLNTSTKIILKTEGAADAAIGAANLGAGDLEAGHFTDMGQFHGYARTIVHGQTRPAFYFKALPAQPYVPRVVPRSTSGDRRTTGPGKFCLHRLTDAPPPGSP